MRKSVYLRVFLLSVFFFQIDTKEILAQENISADTIVVAGIEYKASVIPRILLGAHYRKEWITPVKVKKFNIHQTAGGLKPIKQGGSRQTTNLRLEDANGKEYVLRSVNKKPVKALPENLRKTKVVAYVFQDQTSSEHPYGLLTVPCLSRAAGILHTNPQLVYVPYDTGFGEFATTFAGMLMYFEERPDGDMSHLASSGNSSRVIGSEKMFEEIYKDHDNQVDEKLFARTRLFDMLIGDWGRHEDQWRWATYDYGGSRLYKPIPRDRDHIYFRADGIIPYLSSRKWAFRKNQNFDYNFKDVLGLNLSATSIDRTLLTEITKNDWCQIAESLKSSLSDSAIEISIRQMPPDIFKIHGEEIIKKLKSRRDQLPKAAEKYYHILSKEVSVLGSEKDEVFIVHRINDWKTEVTMTKKNNSDTLYHRIFFTKETQDIRLYGFGGDDQFYVYGGARKGPKVRMIGGEGRDSFVDSMLTKKALKKTFVYDSEEGNEAALGKQTKDMRSDNPRDSVHVYHRYGHRYNTTGILPSFEYNVDDGLFLGIGAMRRTFAFKQYPYATFQRVGLNYALSTSALSFRYVGDFKSFIRKWNLSIDTRIFGPKYVLNYFGFGNESVEKDVNIDFYRVKAREVIFTPTFYRSITKNFEIGLGPQYQYIDVQKTPERFIATSEAKVDSSVFEVNHFAGIRLYSQYSTVNDLYFPVSGLRWKVEGAGYEGLSNPQEFVRIASDFSFFFTPKMPLDITFASRIGGATNFGDFQFYQANTLGGSTNLRGYRRTRYYGRTSFFQNIEMRIKLFESGFFLFPGRMGIIIFYDYGRVWADGEKSTTWHTGFGPGLWFQLLNRTAINVSFGISANDRFLNVKYGFLF